MGGCTIGTYGAKLIAGSFEDIDDPVAKATGVASAAELDYLMWIFRRALRW